MESPNLSTLASEAAAENDAVTVPLLNRNRDPYLLPGGAPVTIAVLGEFSAPVRQAQDRSLRRLSKRRTMEMTPELVLENRLAIAGAALTAWTLDDADHRPIPPTAENLRAVCTLAPWILDQIEEAMRTHARFFETSSPS